MRLQIDAGLCAGHGRCYTLSPELVTADEEGFPVQLGQDVDVAPDQEEAGRRIAANCPEGAIKVLD